MPHRATEIGLQTLATTVLFNVHFSFSLSIHVHICYMLSPVRPSVCLSVVRNDRAPYSGEWNFRESFYAIWHLSHFWPSLHQPGSL